MQNDEVGHETDHRSRELIVRLDQGPSAEREGAARRGALLAASREELAAADPIHRHAAAVVVATTSASSQVLACQRCTSAINNPQPYDRSAAATTKTLAVASWLGKGPNLRWVIPGLTACLAAGEVPLAGVLAWWPVCA
jgi:hypothetical protein